MTQPSPNPHMALYSKLMWPGWNPLAERQGTTDAEAERVIAEHRAAVLDDAIKAVLGRMEAYEGMGQDAVDRNRERTAIVSMLRRMAVGGER
ncbi:hypothetical protein [Streptomyces filamentosus]|uniref:hypothetical protein n=1 Tax=Streptomyces filamentosus TaxID=67294 RepID=UPI001239C7C6|nr:hypothetical protein [Streptomyces filamentosus]KAA6216438.1 hypothetical protein CP979_05365 [Streptomyces filamentosus]